MGMGTFIIKTPPRPAMPDRARSSQDKIVQDLDEPK
jgi:hypothetical protein